MTTAYTVENKTFEEIEVGDTAQLSRTLTKKDIQLFAIMSGDLNPAHLDEEYAGSDIFKGIVAHGMWGGSLISTVLGTQLPGPGTIYLSQTLKFCRPVRVGDRITVIARVIAKDVSQHKIRLLCTCTNQDGKEVIVGEAEVMAPVEKVQRPITHLPQVELVDDHAERYYAELLDISRDLLPLKTAIVHPVDVYSFQGALDAAHEGIIEPIFIGPKRKLEAVSRECNVDLSSLNIIDVEHSHAGAELATQLAKKKEVEAIMKGALHTDEFMHPILENLRTDRRISHVAIITVPTYPKPLFITDVAINIAPGLMEKKDIVQNAIDFFHALHQRIPKVALLSAVETVNEKIPSTLDATALCKMSERGQITGGILDGPLAFDNAISAEAAKVKGIASHVSGDVDILVVPNLEAGNILYKQMHYLSRGETAGIALGARVPIILTSRSDGLGFSRKASCLVAKIFSQRQKQ